jgi:hypothetical protein
MVVDLKAIEDYMNNRPPYDRELNASDVVTSYLAAQRYGEEMENKYTDVSNLIRILVNLYV